MEISIELILEKLGRLETILKPKQNRLSLPILQRICKKMECNLKFMPIWVSTDNIIIEGHHRYIGSVLTGYESEVVSNYPKPRFLNVYEWNDVQISGEDWDTEHKVKLLNEEDAYYNGLSLGEIENIIK